MITQLKNPKTTNYQKLKKNILSDQFAWYHEKTASNFQEDNDVPFFSHSVIARPVPNRTYPKITDEYVSEFQVVLDEIFSYNNLKLNCIYRLNVNMVSPANEKMQINFHSDHMWSHNNIIIYLTNAGGETICEDESFNPSEDDIITFSGYPEKHCHKTSIEKNRIVIVATYI